MKRKIGRDKIRKELSMIQQELHMLSQRINLILNDLGA